MTTSAVTNNAAALAASQNEASAASRAREEQRKPAVEAPREGQNASRYAERQESRAEGRGTKVDRDA